MVADQPDDLELFRGGTLILVSPIPDHAFFEQPVFEGQISDELFERLISRRRSFTSSDVAALVSPANRRLPASRNSFDQP